MKLYYIALAAACLASPSIAATFGADTAVASSEFNANYVAANTINGSGLPAGFGSGDVHAVYTTGNHWTTAQSTTPEDASIEWGFVSPVTMGGIYIWNHLSNGVAANPGYAPLLFDLTLLDSASSVIASFDDVAMSAGTNVDQAFSFASIYTGVSSVLFEVEAVNGSPNYTGLAEVLFDDSNNIQQATVLGDSPPVSAVPLPAGALLLLSALGAMGLSRRKS